MEIDVQNRVTITVSLMGFVMGEDRVEWRMEEMRKDENCSLFQEFKLAVLPTSCYNSTSIHHNETDMGGSEGAVTPHYLYEPLSTLSRSLVIKLFCTKCIHPSKSTWSKHITHMHILWNFGSGVLTLLTVHNAILYTPRPFWMKYILT